MDYEYISLLKAKSHLGTQDLLYSTYIAIACCSLLVTWSPWCDLNVYSRCLNYSCIILIYSQLFPNYSE